MGLGGSVVAKAEGQEPYAVMPSFKELADEITRKKRVPFLQQFSGVQKGCAYVFGSSFALLIFSALFASSAADKSISKNFWIWITEISYVLMLLSWFVFSISTLWKTFRRSRSSANSLSLELNNQVLNEDKLIFRLLQIPAAQLSERHERLELQLKLLDRRAVATKLTLLAGAPLLILAQLLKVAAGNGSGKSWVNLPPGFSASTLVAALTLGAILAAFSLSAESETLHRVSFILKTAAKRSLH